MRDLVILTFSGALALGRIALGHLSDRVGGAKGGGLSVLVEAAGQALMWLASSSALGLFSAALTGFGYTLVLPSGSG